MGFLSVLSGQDNIKLSNTMLDWNVKFYYLDGRGAEFIAHVDKLLLNAQTRAAGYFESEAQHRFTHPDLPVYIQTFIREGYSAAQGSEAFVNQILDMLFFLYADRELERLIDFYPGVIITAPREYINDVFSNAHALICDITLTHPESLDFHLSITVSVNSYTAFRQDLQSGNTAATRFRITGWRWWQSPVVVDSAPTRLWDRMLNLQ